MPTAGDHAARRSFEPSPPQSKKKGKRRGQRPLLNVAVGTHTVTHTTSREISERLRVVCRSLPTAAAGGRVCFYTKNDDFVLKLLISF